MMTQCPRMCVLAFQRVGQGGRLRQHERRFLAVDVAQAARLWPCLERGRTKERGLVCPE
jgi:hypothetical protein